MLGERFRPVHYSVSLSLSTTLSPGRFFAVKQIKAFIAHILVTYDFKFAEGKGAPSKRYVGLFRAPEDADVLFRKRLNQK